MEDILKSDARFRYMMLYRFRDDCEYYLNYGNRNSNVLWSLDESKHIENMKALHNSFGENDKPEWLTWEQILEYEKQMLEVEPTSTAID
ncbi:LPD11 domain-containing protein [Paenibacillus glucanolyticus]|uniref:LPD11 domain-containing protein n=1 Tax=Paenibacillus glucanolyticus TaxID=59843 RepID=UPI00211613D6|nr:LPD11 domain-containing protein [Paenibacillus glucanolyticus]